MNNITIPEALLICFVGLCVVFFVLIILMLSIKIVSFAVNGKSREGAEITPQKTESKTYVKGTCGEVKTFDVPDKTVAMIMTIVADNLQTPLNELKFISIKEIGDNNEI